MRAALLALAFAASGALAETDTVARCLSCHVVDGRLDIVGVAEMQHLPESWPLLFEDASDRDGDGIAGRVSFVSGGGVPLVGVWGKSLAAARFEDFAKIAGAAHNIPVAEDLDEILAAFEALSPAPTSPFQTPDDRRAFEEAGCSQCHVTQTYAVAGRDVMPLSDFLLHDLGKGETRTTPLWGCSSACLDHRHSALETVPPRP